MEERARAAPSLGDSLDRAPISRLHVSFWVLAGMGIMLSELLEGGGDGNLGLVVVGFVLFNYFMNAGPNATTYALPAEVFPSDIRAAGHGFAAACAKLGAALGVFLFPILQGAAVRGSPGYAWSASSSPTPCGSSLVAAPSTRSPGARPPGRHPASCRPRRSTASDAGLLSPGGRKPTPATEPRGRWSRKRSEPW